MPDATELLERADALATEGHTRAAIELLTDANRATADPVLARHLVRLRHDAWSEIERSGPDGWDRDVPDLFAGVDRIPEVDAGELTAEMIRSAQLHHGGLVVRRLLSQEWCERLKVSVDRAWEAIERYRETKQLDPDWFDPLDLDQYGLTMASRAWVLNSGTGYVPDSPRLLFELLEAFDDSGIKPVIADYFEEEPALSWIKLAQRRLAPDAKGGWHQDGAVYGMTARTLNLWLPITRCGDVAPGLEMYPRRLDDMVDTMSDTGTEGFSATADAVQALTDEVPADRPVFEAGDAALFDQFLLHQTAAGEHYTEQRYGFECWFFAPSTYPEPERWIPLAY
ncbi:MAG: phytanoyl-CoA dioxygenase family protein [Acidimicrobiia bacterium]|nr:phytanoyl-CoA dioxygenase family protein [Acidimicrobiia bacterium]